MRKRIQKARVSSEGALQTIAREVKLLTLDISYFGGTGHIGSSLAIADILTVLYFRILRLTGKNFRSPGRDRFILSKGHAAAALYAVLHKRGILSKRRLETFAKDEGGLCEHPERKDPGVEMTTGSLGHGLTFGAGIAWGLKQKNLDGRVFVLISDGECGEGSVWEGAILAARLKLDNLIVILDHDRWQCFGKVADVTGLARFGPKWKSFGWNVIDVDGHSLSQLERVLTKAAMPTGRPTFVDAHTISGRGISLIEDQLIGHYKVFTPGEYQKARIELTTS